MSKKAPAKSKVITSKAPAVAKKSTDVKPKEPKPVEVPVKAPEPVEPIEVNLKRAVQIVFDRLDENLNNADKWPVIIDENTRFSAFCRHRDSRYIDCMFKEDLVADKIRLKILSSYFFGVPLVIDTGDNLNMLGLFKDVCNEIDPKIYDDIFNKNICKNEERYRDLIRDNDGDEYDAYKIRDCGKFYVCIITTNEGLGRSLSNIAIPYIIPS